jgi:hypothetical protein
LPRQTDDKPLPDQMINQALRDERRERLRPKGIKVTVADIGRAVVYRTAPNYEPEQGIITSFNDKYVFVRYGSSIRGVATDPDDLDWVSPRKPASLGEASQTDMARIAGKLGRAAMPEPERIDADLGEGARRKLPIREE